MPGGRVFWQANQTNLPPGTAAGPYHYTVHLGTLEADEPAGVSEHVFLNVPPGDHPASVETKAANGVVLATMAGPTLTVPVPPPVVVPIAGTVGVTLVP